MAPDTALTRFSSAVLDLTALAALTGVAPLDPPEVESAIAPDVVLVDVVDLLRTYHDHRPADVHGDLVLLGASIAEWVPASRYLAALTEMSCAQGELPISDVAALALARTARLPLITGLAELAGIEPDVAVFVLPRRT